MTIDYEKDNIQIGVTVYKQDDTIISNITDNILEIAKNKRPQRGLDNHQLFCFFNNFCEAIFFQTSTTN